MTGVKGVAGKMLEVLQICDMAVAVQLDGRKIHSHFYNSRHSSVKTFPCCEAVIRSSFNVCEHQTIIFKPSRGVEIDVSIRKAKRV